jgi:hypothetical protein
LENVASGRKDADDLFKIIERIHLVIQQMRKRHDGRPTLDVVDEYDLQDVVHALLRLSFDDVREEEWVASYAGSSSRADFLLPELESVLELKMMRATMSTKQLGEQLIVDIAKYKTTNKLESEHPRFSPARERMKHLNSAGFAASSHQREL